jgi:hypothetical protein
MTALNIFLAVVGLIVTMMVLTGMMFLKPHHITTPAELTDLSDVEQRFGPPVADVPAVADPVVEEGTSELA